MTKPIRPKHAVPDACVDNAAHSDALMPTYGSTQALAASDTVPAGLMRKGRLYATAALLCVSGLSLGGLAPLADSVPVLKSSGTQSPNNSAKLSANDPLLGGNFATPAQIDLRTGRNNQSGRLEIYGTIGSRASVRKADDQVVIRLPSTQKPDIGGLRSHLPIGVESIDLKSDARAFEIWLKLTKGAKAHFGRADGAVFIQFDPGAEANQSKNAVSVSLQDAKSAATSSNEPKPVVAAPVLKTIPVEVGFAPGQVDLSFAFEGPAGAAVFRRGEAIWVVFDREVGLKVPDTLKNNRLIRKFDWVSKDGFTAVRIEAPSVSVISALSDNLNWRVRLGGGALEDTKATQIGVTRDLSSGVAQLNANLSGASKIAWIRDPDIGDKMAVITARGPIKSLRQGRKMLEANLAPTTHGLLVETVAPDIKVVIEGDLVEVSRPNGLSLSNQTSADAATRKEKVEYAPAAYPSMMDAVAWADRKGASFTELYNRLQTEASEEQQLGLEGPTKARLSLARFLIGHGLDYEAQGVLTMLARKNPRSQNDPYVRGLMVMAKVASGRLQSAITDLDTPVLQLDPSAQLWRGYIEARAGHFQEARKAFLAGASALDKFPPLWRARFGAANALSALYTNDLKAAQQLIGYSVNQDVVPLEKLDALLVNARIIEAAGDKMRALGVYQEIAKASLGRISTPAQLHAEKLKLELGRAKTQDVLKTMDNLRFRWRGDDTELEIIATIGDIYLTAGRYREALEVLKTGGQKFFNRPQGLALNDKLNRAFRGLFLEGMADGLQPIEALGLYYDFKDLTPVGSDGDEMVRRLARRLIDVDLLDQAAKLLQYQVDNRLQGVAKAAVASDLAAVFLMNREPEKALQSIWKTRTTLLPKVILADRRVLEARALSELGRFEQALESLGPDLSPDALDVRADVFWRQKDWARAGLALEKRLGDRYKQDGALSVMDEGRLIRAGVAYSLKADNAALTRLSQRFSKFINEAKSADAMRVALAGMDNGPLDPQEFALAAAQVDTFSAWVTGMKKKLRDKSLQPLPQTLSNVAPSDAALKTRPSARAA